MNIGMWVMSTGMMLSTALFLTALFNMDPWKDHSYNYAPPITAGAPSPHASGREHMVCSSCHQIIDPMATTADSPIPPIVSGATSPHRDSRSNQVCAQCHRILTPQEAAILARKNAVARVTAQAKKGADPQVSSRSGRASAIPVAAVMPIIPPLPPSAAPFNPEWHESFRSIRFQGKVLKVIGRQPTSGRNHVNILVDNGIRLPTWVNLAPEWYMKSRRCQISTGFYVKGVAFRDARSSNGLLYGQSIAVNGQLCAVRNSHMRGLWNATTENNEADEAE